MRFLNHKPKKLKLLLFSQLIIILWLFSFFPAFAQQIAAGENHTCVIKKDDPSYPGIICWGSNSNGQIGDETLKGDSIPSLVFFGAESAEEEEMIYAQAQVIVAESNSNCLLSNDVAWCWGGWVASDVNDDKLIGTRIIDSVSSIALSGSHTCALLQNGGVKCWGKNDRGQLGDGTIVDKNTPTQVNNLTAGVKAIALGLEHTCALLEDGSVKCWGANNFGQLGDGTTVYKNTPTDINGLTAGVKAIALGYYHSCALLESGGVKCWGSNYVGQLGDGTTVDKNTPTQVNNLTAGVKAIALGYNHSCALLESGGVKCWGANNFGQLGDGTTVDKYTPTDVKGLTTGVKAIALSDDTHTSDTHTCALLESGGVKCWGINNYGQLGDGTTVDKNTPTDVKGLTAGVKAIALGDTHTCALLESGGVKCWGNNVYLQVGYHPDTVETPDHYPEPVDVTFYWLEETTHSPILNNGNSSMNAYLSEDNSKDITLNAFDADGDTLTWRISSWPSHGQVNLTGETGTSQTINYTPSTDYNGTDSFEVEVSDGNSIDIVTVNLTIDPVIDGLSITDATTWEDMQTTEGLVITPNAVDMEVTEFRITNIKNGKLYYPNGIIEIQNGDFVPVAEAEQGLKFTPNTNSIKEGSFDVRGAIEERWGGETVTATITVIPVADPPTVTAAISEEGHQTTTGLVISRNRVDGEEVTHFQIDNIQHGTLFQNDGETQIREGDFITIEAGQAGLKFTPNEGIFTPGSGIEQGSFEVFAATADNEEGLGEESVTAIIDFDLVNDPPILEPIGEQLVPFGQLVNFTAQAKDPNLQMQNLSFSLQNAPAGATIHPTTGQFTWRPEKPGVYSATVVVTDDGDQPASTLETIEIKVIEKPVLAELLLQTVPVGETLTFTAIATHHLGLPLVYSLINNTLPGATIDPTTGEFNWTPSREDTFYVTIQVAETVTQLTDEQTVFISVSNNTPPELTPIPNQVIPLNRLFKYQVIATDRQANQLLYQLDEAPTGATLHALNGQLTWVANQPGPYTFKISVTEIDGIPMNLTARTQFQVTVNTQPNIDDIEAQIVNLGNTLTYQINAIHPSGNPLGYRLMNELPGAQIDPNTGLFTWTPEQAGTYDLQIQAFDKTDETLTNTQVMTLTANLVETRLILELSSNVILSEGSLQVTGHLFREVKTALSSSDLPISVRISGPNNTSWNLPTQTQADGSFEVNELPALEKGSYQFEAYFQGNHAFAKSQSDPQPLTVREVAGYAILIQGRTADDEDGVAAYNKTMNRAYLAMKKHGFKDEDIEYLNFNTEQSNIGIEVDAKPSISAIQVAFDKLQARLNAAPAPLFLVMVDHGSIDGTFYIDQGDGASIKTAEVSYWLDTLEAGLNPDAQAQPRIVIVGSCYAGTFLPPLSKPGRTIIVSATEDEESYKGPKEPDETRSGEFFTEAFFSWLARNKSVKKAFELATIATEITTRQEDDDGTAITNRFQDNAAQHPLLDDNGDQIGSNVLSTGFGDGLIAKDIYLGSGLRPEKEMSAHITDITETRYLDATTSVTELFAVVNNANRVKDNQVIVDIRPPSLALASQGVEAKSALEINELIRRVLPASSELNRFSGYFDVFQKPGKYEVMYFVVDTETGEISPFERSLVYKNHLGNRPPEAFHLQVPENESEPETTLIFDWKGTFDPDIEPLTYTLLIATIPHCKKWFIDKKRALCQ